MATQTDVQTGTGAGPAAATPHLVARKELAWGPNPGVFPEACQMCVVHGDPGVAGIFVVRLRAGEGFVFAPHSHPHDELVTIVSGRMTLGNGRTLDRSGARTLEAGDFAFLPREQFHFAWSESDDLVFQVEADGPFGITFANPADDPRNAPVH